MRSILLVVSIFYFSCYSMAVVDEESFFFTGPTLVLSNISGVQLKDDLNAPQFKIESFNCPGCYIAFDSLIRYSDTDKISIFTGIRGNKPVQSIRLNSQSEGSREIIAMNSNISSITYYNFILCEDYSDQNCRRINPTYEFTWNTGTGQYQSTIPLIEDTP